MRNELKTVQINNEQLQREKSALELDLNNLKHDKEELKRQIDYNQKLMDSISQELVRERNDKMQIQENFKSVRGEHNTLTRQLKSLNNRKVNLDRKLRQMQEDKAALESKLTSMETMLTGKINQIGQIKDELNSIRGSTAVGQAAPEPAKPAEKGFVELPPIVVRPQSEAGQDTSRIVSTASGVGKVLAINRDNNFIVVDLGEDSGIKIGDILQVTRDSSIIATVEVIQTRRNISAGDIKRESSSIKVGDIVK